MLVAYLAARPIVFVITEISWSLKGKLTDSADASWLLYMLLLAWSGYVLVRLLRRFSDASSPRLLGVTIVYVLVCYASLWTFPRSTLWYTNENKVRANPYAELYKLNVEDTFYAQRPLLAQGVARLEAQRPGVADLYFLGVGGYGLENVFLNEVEYVRGLFDQRFGTAGRSLVLANNVASVERYPLANRHNLAEALAAMAARMDTDEDVLFLFMTSHGSDKPRFSFEFGPLKLNDLSPQQLRQALDEAGIHWRVIVVSSCYSGGFVEPLQDPGTLIITASAKDRQSFGCGASSDFTDFGTAYFKQALARQADFIQAFDVAASWVADKEQRERREPSLPQRYVGEAVAAKLAALRPGLTGDVNAASMQLPMAGCDENNHAQGVCR
jgi:hypothetical protein